MKYSPDNIFVIIVGKPNARKNLFYQKTLEGYSSILKLLSWILQDQILKEFKISQKPSLIFNVKIFHVNLDNKNCKPKQHESCLLKIYLTHKSQSVVITDA